MFLKFHVVSLLLFHHKSGDIFFFGKQILHNTCQFNLTNFVGFWEIKYPVLLFLLDFHCYHRITIRLIDEHF